MFSRSLPFVQCISGSKAIFSKLPPKLGYPHPFVTVQDLFLVDCSPEYIERYFSDYNFQIKHVWLHTTLPNHEFLLQPFDFCNPVYHILEYDYEKIKYKQNNIIPTTTSEFIINALL